MGQFCPSLINNNNSTKFIIGFWFWVYFNTLVLCIWPNLCLIYTLLWFISMLDIFVLYLELSQYTFMVCYFLCLFHLRLNKPRSPFIIFSLFNFQFSCCIVMVLLRMRWILSSVYVCKYSDCLSVKQMETFFAQVAYVHLDIVNRHFPINHLNHHSGHPNIAFT